LRKNAQLWFTTHTLDLGKTSKRIVNRIYNILFCYLIDERCNFKSKYLASKTSQKETTIIILLDVNQAREIFLGDAIRKD